MGKPKFYQAKLKLIKGNVLKEVYTPTTNLTIKERMGSEEANCPDCGKNEWWLYPIESASVREGGKPYCECMNCGYLTHL